MRTKWVLIDDSHPRFNIWMKKYYYFGKYVDSYRECFRKDIDPNCEGMEKSHDEQCN